MQKKLALLTALIVLITLFAGCGDSGSPANSGGAGAEDGYADTLRVVLNAEPSNLFPWENTEMYTSSIERAIYNTLIYRDDDQEFIGEIAETWEYINDETVRFHLRDDITFSNGEQLTAEDVKFSLELANEGSKTLYSGALAGVDIVDEYTVDVRTIGTNAPLFSNLAHARSSIVSKKVYEEIGLDAYSRSPIGSGPFTLEDWTTGSSMTLKRRDDYWGEMPAFETLIATFVTESANRSIELETGAADIILVPEPNDLERLASAGYIIAENASNSVSQINVNMQQVPDINVRKAIAYAIDYDAVIEAVYDQTAGRATGILPNMMGEFSKANYDVNYDPELAREFMAQSGSPGGVTLEMVVINQTELTNLAEAMQFYWREVGINVEIAQGDQATMRERTDAGDYMFTVSNSTWFTGDPSRPTVNFTSQRKNYGFNEEILANTDRLWEQGVQTIDLDARVAIYDELTEYIMEQWVFFPIAHKKIYYAHNDKVENFFANPSGSPDFQRVRIRQ